MNKPVKSKKELKAKKKTFYFPAAKKKKQQKTFLILTKRGLQVDILMSTFIFVGIFFKKYLKVHFQSENLSIELLLSYFVTICKRTIFTEIKLAKHKNVLLNDNVFANISFLSSSWNSRNILMSA